MGLIIWERPWKHGRRRQVRVICGLEPNSRHVIAHPSSTSLLSKFVASDLLQATSEGRGALGEEEEVNSCRMAEN